MKLTTNKRMDSKRGMIAGILLLGMLTISMVSQAFSPLDGTILLGRPTDSSIAISVVADTTSVTPEKKVEIYFEYGVEENALSHSTETASLQADPAVILLSGLSPNTRYFYRMGFRDLGDESGVWEFTGIFTFQTQRARGESFTFTVQADSHFGSASEVPDYTLYRHTLEMIQADEPDFHFDLGDTFMITTNSGFRTRLDNYPKVYKQYLDHRGYFGIVGWSAPIFLVIGNHENEEGWNLDDTPDPYISYPMMSQNGRKRYFLNPVPDDFYSGNALSMQSIDGDHLRDTVYAFEWGDALFVSIDPYFFTMNQPYNKYYGQENGDEAVPTPWSPELCWHWTLGDAQYQWLKDVLRNSDAKYKFVFSHQLAGGSVNGNGNGVEPGYGRGAGAFAHLFEWGGFDEEGEWAFDEYRHLEAGWDVPIHSLMVETGVTVFFHGHDHLYAKETRDSVIYQEVPRPCARIEDNNFVLAELDYDTSSMDAHLSSGYLRVTVSPTETTVQYIGSDAVDPTWDGEVVHEYSIPAEPEQTPPMVQNVNAQTAEEQAVEFELEGADREGDAFEYEIIREPHHGVLSGAPPRLTFTPDANFFGLDNVVYRATDGTLNGNIGYVTFNVSPVDDPPEVSDQTLHIQEDEMTTLLLPSHDADGETLIYTIVEGPAHGALTGDISSHPEYTPNENYYGEDEIVFEATDSHSVISIRFTIHIQPVNDRPVLQSIAPIAIPEDETVVITPAVTDGDGDPVLVSPSVLPAFGTLTSLGNEFIYQPDNDFFGVDRFTLIGHDGMEDGNEVEVVVTVLEVDDPPRNFEFSELLETDEDTPLFINLPGEDPDFDPVSFVIQDAPRHGELSGDGAFVLYSPEENYSGADSFTFYLVSGNLMSETATVSIAIHPVPDPPQALSLSMAAVAESSVSILLNALDVDSSDVAYDIVRQPKEGNLFGEGNTYVYRPREGFLGTDTFMFSATDETGNRDEGEVSINIEAKNRDKTSVRNIPLEDQNTETSTVEDGTDKGAQASDDGADSSDSDRFAADGETDGMSDDDTAYDSDDSLDVSDGTESPTQDPTNDDFSLDSNHDEFVTKSCGCAVVGAVRLEALGAQSPFVLLFLVF